MYIAFLFLDDGIHYLSEKGLTKSRGKATKYVLRDSAIKAAEYLAKKHQCNWKTMRIK